MTEPTTGERLAAAIEWTMADDPWPPAEIAGLPADEHEAVRRAVLDLRDVVIDKIRAFNACEGNH
jgi:hypothetical protein